MSTNPHDALFKAAFGQPDLARSELELVVPGAILAQLDMATLEVAPGSFVDEELRGSHTDLLYAVRTRTGDEARVYVLFEHQSTHDAQMPLRMLRYIVAVWSGWLRDHPGASKLPVVLPVLLHHGESGWRAAPDLAPMLDASPDLLDAVRPFQPLFRFVLDDITGVSASALAGRRLHELARLVLLAMWASRSFERLQQVAPRMRAILASILVRDERVRALLSQLYVYAHHTAPPDVDRSAVRSILLYIAGPEGREDVMNAAEQLIAEGVEKGRAMGLAEGLRIAVAELMSRRALPLSDVGRARLESCVDASLLMQWHARAVTASSEAELFAT